MLTLCTTRINIQKFSVLLTEYIIVFCVAKRNRAYVRFRVHTADFLRPRSSGM
jgi:hypothetical protein